MRTERKAGAWTRALAWLLIVATASTLAAPREGWALLVPAERPASAADITQRRQDLQRIGAALESKIVRSRLAELGFSPQEVDRRLAKLSDAELHQLSQRAEALNPGGDGGFDTVVALGAIAVLVLLLLYLIKKLG